MRITGKLLTKGMRLEFFSLSDVRENPYPELALPGLARAGWEISIFAPGASQSLLRKHLPFPCTSHDLRLRSGTSRFAAEAELFRQMLMARIRRPEFIYINSQSLSSRAVLAFAGPLLGTKLVYHNPDYYDPVVYPVRYRLERHFARRASIYINNEFHRALITSVDYRLKAHTIVAPPNLPIGWPIPDRNVDKRAELAAGLDDAFVLMLHGGYSKVRMVPELLSALSVLPKRFRLSLTGGEETRRRILAEGGGASILERITILPRLGFQDLLAYSVNADCGVLLYQNNDMGNFFTSPGRLTEYLACGLPVLATNHTGLENLVLRFRLGVSVDSQDPRRLSEAILLLERIIERGEVSRKEIRKRFTSTFAFDHWENSVVDAFSRSLEGTPHDRGPRFPWLNA